MPGNRLLADYLGGTLTPGEFFARDFRDDGAPGRRAEPAALSAALVAFQQRLGADEAAVANARRLADPLTPVVTVGQQPGLLTGPLYTPYKALTAISLARHIGTLRDRTAVPVFWAGCDDDDRGEVDHCGCWDQRGQMTMIHYPEEAGEPGQLAGSLPAGEYGGRVIAQLAPLLDGLPYAGDTLALLRGTLAESADLGEWFCRLLARLFGPLGMVVCDPRLPEMRRLGAEVLRRELAEPLHTTRLVNEGAEKLHAAGYAPALTKPEETVNLFLADGLRRQRVSYRDGQFIAAGATHAREDLLAMLAADPGCLLPNAVLRPVVQEYLFGSAAFVAGPHELCYWAELLPVFRALGVEMPPVVPRAGATLVSSGTASFLRNHRLDALSLLHDYDGVRLRLLAEAQPAAMQLMFTRAREQVDGLVAGMAEVLADYESTLAGSALATQQRMLNEVERLERKALKAVERRSTELTERLEASAHSLFPGRGLQERLLNIGSLLARFGQGVPEQLLDLLDGQEGYHLVVEI